MQEFLSYFKEKKNLINLLIFGIILLGLPIGVGLVRQQQILKSRAAEDPIVFTGSNVSQKSDGSWVATSPQISLRIASPLGPPAGAHILKSVAPQGLVKTAYADDCSGSISWNNSCTNKKLNVGWTVTDQGSGCNIYIRGGYTDWVISDQCTGNREYDNFNGAALTNDGIYQLWVSDNTSPGYPCYNQHKGPDAIISCVTPTQPPPTNPPPTNPPPTNPPPTNPPPDGGSCTVSWNLNTSPPAGTDVDVRITGESSTNNDWSDIRLTDNGNSIDTLKGISGHVFTYSVPSGSAGSSHNLAFAVLHGSRACSPGASFTTATAATKYSCNSQYQCVADPAGQDLAACQSTCQAPSAIACSEFSPGGLADTGQVGPGGIKIWSTSDYRGGRRNLHVTRSPANANIARPAFTKEPGTAADLAFEEAADRSGNWLVNIPDNNTTVNNDYTVSTSIQSGSDTQTCTPFIIRVPAKPVDTACPADIRSTQARVSTTGIGGWSTGKTINLGQFVFVAGFHNNQINDPAPDMILEVTGPEDSPDSQTQTLTGSDNKASFTPVLEGRYTITARKAGVSDDQSRCIGSSTLVVNPAPAVTTHYRLAENRSDLNIREGQPGFIPWQVYDVAGKQVNYNFRTPGQKTIFVQFKDDKGKEGGCGFNQGEPCQAQIKVLSPDPAITGCSLSPQGADVIFTINGTNFGTARGSVQSGDNNLTVQNWNNTQVKVSWSNPPTGQAFPVTLTNADNQSVNGQCSAVSSLSVGGKYFCHSPGSAAQSNVELIVIEATAGARAIKQMVNIDRDGNIQGLNVKLEEGKKYRISLKAPRSLRRVAEITAAVGTTNVPNFTLPVGDIFPIEGGDGMINNFDKAELNREWIAGADVAGRPGDFNQDGRVNAIDWSCMRQNFNQVDDSEPTAPNLPVGVGGTAH